MAASVMMKLALLFLSITSHQVLATQQQHTINVQSLLSTEMCSSAPAASVTPASSHPGAGRTFQIVRRSCLPASENKTVSDHYTAILHRDHHRVRSIHRRLAGSQSAITIPARLGLPFHSREYVITVGIGTPPQNLTVLFDTGSDLTWVQCAPCGDSCHPQEEPLFDPKKSSTYAGVRCDEPECRILSGGDQSYCGIGFSCAYTAQYADQSQTLGDLAKETVTLSPVAPPATGVVFGCSYKTAGLLRDATVAGLLGLGRGDSSILSQTRRTDDGGVVFSYCLPSRGASTGYLTIGDTPQQPNVTFTPLKTTDDPRLSSVYVVELSGISVSGHAVPIPASALTVVDSGTVVTHMPRAAYLPLRDEFRRHMGGYTMLPEGSVPLLDTCYNVTGLDVVTAPRVAFEFAGGARMDVDASGILFVAGAIGEAVACLAFVPTNSVGLVIMGNMQQRAHQVVFDVAGGRLGFGPGGCS